jgi:hypothetical protein
VLGQCLELLCQLRLGAHTIRPLRSDLILLMAAESCPQDEEDGKEEKRYC